MANALITRGQPRDCRTIASNDDGVKIGCFFYVGAGNVEKGIVYPHHHPRFTIDEDALEIGVQMFVAATLNSHFAP